MVAKCWTDSAYERHTIIFRTIRYDTIYLRALKSLQYGQLSLAQGIETKK